MNDQLLNRLVPCSVLQGDSLRLMDISVEEREELE